MRGRVIIPQFKKSILVYLPCRNCAGSIIRTLSDIAGKLSDKIECLIVDNHSADLTSEILSEEVRQGRFPFKVHVLRTKSDIGYAGSQKLAYSLVLKSDEVRYVVMLHGDGQYPSSLLTKLTANIGNGYAVVNTYRDKKIYPITEETPPITYFTIKILSWIESLMTGFSQKEWHSGFVMYSRDFLKKIPLEKLSNNMHIDGEFLICAGVLGEKTLAIPIYKQYKGREVFHGIPRVKHIADVFRVILKFRERYYSRILSKNSGNEIDFDFDIIV